MENIITVKALTKIFKVHYREKGGIRAAVQSLFHRKYNTVVAVDDIHFQVKKGEVRALLGPNGAGKSTTIKMLSGILYPTAGEISVMGFTPWREREQYVRNIGVLFGQKGQLTWELPAIDSYLILKEIYKIPLPQFKKNLDGLIDLFHIGSIVQKPIRNLSLGERMKCEFVGTLLHEPKLVFLDEPTIGMDVISKDIVRDYIKKCNQELGVTFILTSHDLTEIVDLCGKITIINYGKVVFDDTIESLRTYFSSKKVVEIQFRRALTKQEINQFHIEMTGPQTGLVTISNQDDELQSTIAQIVNNLPIRDLNINENSIESIIKNIYQQKQVG